MLLVNSLVMLAWKLVCHSLHSWSVSWQMEKINYMSWKETNKDTDSMTVVSILSIIPFLYFLWVAFFSETVDVDF